MLEKLFGSQTREMILSLYLSQPEACYYTREIERKLGLRVSAVRREIENLLQVGLLREVPDADLETLFDDPLELHEIRTQKRKYYAVNSDFIFFPELKALFAKNKFLARNALIKKLRRLGEIDLLVLTGSFAGREDISVDILIVGGVSHQSVEKMIAEFETELNSPVYWALFTREEYENRKSITDKFLFEILQGHKIELINKIDYPVDADFNQPDDEVEPAEPAEPCPQGNPDREAHRDAEPVPPKPEVISCVISASPESSLKHQDPSAESDEYLQEFNTKPISDDDSD